MNNFILTGIFLIFLSACVYVFTPNVQVIYAPGVVLHQDINNPHYSMCLFGNKVLSYSFDDRQTDLVDLCKKGIIKDVSPWGKFKERWNIQ